MKTRIEVITDERHEEILSKNGYKQVGRFFQRNGRQYKIAWLHLNDWEQLVYIDLIEV
ncbi:MAG: hypothetical protein R6U19_06170 [Bacteroidales bacterium]